MKFDGFIVVELKYIAHFLFALGKPNYVVTWIISGGANWC